MIQKIIRIKNVGRLADCTPRGDVAFRRLNVILAPNGRGKTTLCDILRSLQSGQSDYIVGRKTLGCTGDPEIELRLENTNARYAAGQWDQTEPNILIFGSEFIDQNVYTGNAVSHEQKRNLYRVVIGDGNVVLARAVDDLDRQIRDAQQDINEKQLALTQLLPKGMDLKTFLALAEQSDLDEKIAKISKELRALERADQIKRKPALADLRLPTMPEAFANILARSLTGISSDAEQKLRRHIAEHTEGAADQWITDGLGYIKDSLCPFCGQRLTGLDIIATYQAFFGESYADLRSEIDSIASEVASFGDESTIVNLLRIIESNSGLAEFWADFLTADLPTVDEVELRSTLTNLAAAAKALIARKERSPLDSIRPDDLFTGAETALSHLSSHITAYNTRVAVINEEVATKKRDTLAGDLPGTQTALGRIQAAKTRYSAEATAACSAYTEAVEAKKRFEDAKKRAKDKLDAESDAVLKAWESDLNRLLLNFGAEFGIGKMGRSYLGGSPSSSYHIIINQVPVELGDQNSPRSTPSFRNTLSTGDRTTLGFAFFLAKAERDPSLEQKLVIFDDPFSSQDRSRRSYTQQCISRIARRAKQVVVLSHDPGFLRMISEANEPGQVRCLKLVNIADRTELVECDLREETCCDFQGDYNCLMRYCDENKGDPRLVARCIRPLLEGALRRRYPGSFPDSEWLGDFLERIRTAQPADPLAGAQALLHELGDINDFSKRYHHDKWESEPVDPIEVATYGRRTLRVFGGF